MALKQDERALLQLVCERGQSYEDLAGLLGISEDEVRAKARSALTELGGADPDAEVGLTDYLLGQADPIGRADAVRYLQQDAEARELASSIATKIQAIAPAASLPAIPEPKTRRRKAATAPPGPGEPVAKTVAQDDGSGVSAVGAPRSSRQNRLIAGLAAAGVILVFVILAVAGVFDGGGDESSDTSPEAAAAEAQREITPVDLTAVDGSGVAGTANFGLANDQLFVDLDLNGLDPKLDRDSVYVIWMMLNENGGYPVSIILPDEQGAVQERYAVPTPVAVAIGSNARSVVVSESPRKDLQQDINDAVKAGAPIVPFSGEQLAEGKIPLAAGQADTGTGAGSGTDSGTTGG
jgi:hypothetical protein